MKWASHSTKKKKALNHIQHFFFFSLSASEFGAYIPKWSPVQILTAHHAAQLL
jgi:hypothetical protein